MKAYISLSRAHIETLRREIKTIVAILGKSDIFSIVFAEEFQFEGAQEKETMQQAMKEIDACDLLIADVSDKAIGVGLEAGYAKGKGKMIIYLRGANTEHSTTVSGISDYHIIYRNPADLKSGLEKVIKLWLSQRVSKS